MSFWEFVTKHDVWFMVMIGCTVLGVLVIIENVISKRHAYRMALLKVPSDSEEEDEEEDHEEE